MAGLRSLRSLKSLGALRVLNISAMAAITADFTFCDVSASQEVKFFLWGGVL